MRIKELHLRNIASIEKADIDFENDIKDVITGDPASIFLISGDTGTGKSVLLDGISMALYKKTPRIVGVVNKLNNEYIDNDGETISINSIEQYTRLGISEKDECYSELVFEGNDCKVYRARLDLGFLRGNKDENGHRPLKHRSPVWRVKVGDEDWQRVDGRSGQPILDAVGLSFEQFGRMAMLAQGQFALFLTGDKSERESILEQLTNTARFTIYGKAISNLYNKAKNNKASVQVAYDTERNHTLESDVLCELRQQQEVLKADKDRLDAEYRKLTKALNTVKDMERNATERQKFEGLLAINTEEGRTTSLAKAVQDWTAKSEAAKTLVEAKVKAIDTLASERNRLNPIDTNNNLKVFNQRRTSLERLQDRILKHEEKRSSVESLKQDIEAERKGLSELEVAFVSAQKRYQDSLNKKEEASSLLTTMQMSKNDMLRELRKRLQRDNAETCPLCGQRLDHLHVDEDFAKMLSPLQRREDAAKAELKEATSLRDNAKSKYDTLKGALDTKQKNYERLLSEVEKESKAVAAEVVKLGLNDALPIAEQISETIVQLGNDIVILEDRQKKAEALQGDINRLTKEKAPLDSDLNTADRELLKARNAVAQNERDIENLTRDIAERNKRNSELTNELSVLLEVSEIPTSQTLESQLISLNDAIQKVVGEMGVIDSKLKTNDANIERLRQVTEALDKATVVCDKWERLNDIFGGTRFRTLVQTYILRPLLNNANIYLEKITDRYTLTCSEENEHLSILVLDRYNKNQVRSVTVLSGGERFMISLALSLALSSLNRQDMNVNILFIDEGFGTLDETSLNSVMATLEKLQEIAGQSSRRVGIISHREELAERIPVKILVKRRGEGRSHVEISNN